MKASLFLNPTSEHPERMNEFYRNVLGLPPRPESGPDAMAAAGATIAIDGHRETCGATREPHRFLMDFTVADLAAEQARMEAAGARFTRTAGREEWGGLISTFVDPDGNYGQLFQVPEGMGPAGGEPGQVLSFTLDITSTDPERLLEFYRDVVGLEPFPAIGPHGLQVSEGALIHVDTHSETRGPNAEPSRMLIDFFVEDVVAERQRLEAAGVRFFRKEGTEFWGGVISSFLDPDGNILQLTGYDPAFDTTLNAQG